MRHLGARIVIVALDVEGLFIDAAVEDRLIAAQADGHRVERCQHLLPKALPLLFRGDRYLFDVSAEAAVVDAVIERERTSTTLVQNMHIIPVPQA